MTDSLLASYEEVPYESKPVPGCHPDSLATIASLFGMRPPALETCRVLELGCAGGGNLIPMALTLPRGRFVGIDLSPGQIASGQQVVDALGLTNIELKSLSILDVGTDFGTFDYILCHGVYSWVPPDVQDKILTICKDHLAPDGIAYVSYNTYPGWHLRGLVRDMLCYHARDFKESEERVRQARAFLDFLVQVVGSSETTYGQLLKEEAEHLRTQTDSYFFHEQLEAVNDPLYFHQFAGRAAAKGLQYLGESRLSSFDAQLSPDLESALDQMAHDLVEREQYLDFLRNRTFRRTLLCHANVPLDRNPTPQRLTEFLTDSFTMPLTTEPDLTSAAVEQFRGPDGAAISTNNPLLKTALYVLSAAAPRALPFESFWKDVNCRLEHAEVAHGRHDLALALFECFVSGLVQFHVYAPTLAPEPGERPRGSPLARLQAANNVPRLTNLWHRLVELSVFDRLVLCHLDGQRNRAALLDVLAGFAAGGALEIRHEGELLQDTEKIKVVLSVNLEPSLRRLAALALLAE